MEVAEEGIASEGGQSGGCMLFPRQGLLLPVLILLLEGRKSLLTVCGSQPQRERRHFDVVPHLPLEAREGWPWAMCE